MTDESGPTWITAAALDAEFRNLKTRGQALRNELYHRAAAAVRAYEKLNGASLDELRKAYDVAPIIQQYGTWAVTEFGVECLVDDYPIDRDRVHEVDWVEHMCGKAWCVMEDFKPALRAARHRWPPREGKPFAHDLDTD